MINTTNLSAGAGEAHFFLKVLGFRGQVTPSADQRGHVGPSHEHPGHHEHSTPDK
jgi:hypothetical protein